MASVRRLTRLISSQSRVGARATASTSVKDEVGNGHYSAIMKAFPVKTNGAQAKVSFPQTGWGNAVDFESLLPSNGKIDEMTHEEMDSLVSLKPKPAHAFPDIVKGTRFRKSCYFDATVESGVQKFVTYNHMLLPSFYHDQEYQTLRNDVCLWDVAAQRQVELAGPDALKLAQLITPRELGKMEVGDCLYAITTDTDGTVTNDPIVLKVAADRFWFSIADGDLIHWVKGVAWAKEMDVRISEAQVSPCALQGPKSLQLVQDLFGEWAADLKYYKFREVHLDGIPMLLARSGWSPERGYELYLMDESRGNDLWMRLMDAGKKYGIRPGCPNQARRIEGGMLSYGADIKQHNALELGLPKKMVMKDGDFIGKQALQQLMDAGGAKRAIVGLRFARSEPLQQDFIHPWGLTGIDGDNTGIVTSFSYSPSLSANLGIATVNSDLKAPGSEVKVMTPGGMEVATVAKLPFMKRM